MRVPLTSLITDGYDEFLIVNDSQLSQQEAQLSQSDHATLRVIEYFAKSLEVTQGHSEWHCWVGRV